MTVKELKKLLDESKWPDNAKIGAWDGDYSIREPYIVNGLYYDEKRHMVIIADCDEPEP